MTMSLLKKAQGRKICMHYRDMTTMLSCNYFISHIDLIDPLFVQKTSVYVYHI